MINPDIFENIARYQAEFRSAKPFRHVVIDDFFETPIAEQMLADFPDFRAQNALNEMGEVGGKAVVENIADISPVYRQVSDYLKSPGFLLAVSELTGIKDLLHDDFMYGGGTHENLHGQELDAHVDFNYDHRTGRHRRLNLLLYLNKEWDESWGGLIELHSNPRQPDKDEIKSISPNFNRCLIFETNEFSWHGFPRIELPEDRRHLSRKSFSIYLYTDDRPSDEIAPPHSTFYVQRPLPEHIKSGHTLSESDVWNIKSLIIRRDGWIEYYQNRELANGRLGQEARDPLAGIVSFVRVPVVGYVLQQGKTKGYWGDGWVAQQMEFRIKAERDIKRIRLTGFVPYTTRNEIRIEANEFGGTYNVKVGEEFTLDLDVQIERECTVDLRVHASETMSGLYAGVNDDSREGSFLLHCIRFD